MDRDWANFSNTFPYKISADFVDGHFVFDTDPAGNFFWLLVQLRMTGRVPSNVDNKPPTEEPHQILQSYDHSSCPHARTYRFALQRVCWKQDIYFSATIKTMMQVTFRKFLRNSPLYFGGVSTLKLNKNTWRALKRRKLSSQLNKQIRINFVLKVD